MNRTAKRAIVLIATLSAVCLCLPGAALADNREPGPIIIFGNGNHVAGRDILNSGHSGVGAGSPGGSGPTVPGVGATKAFYVLVGERGPILTLRDSYGGSFPQVLEPAGPVGTVIYTDAQPAAATYTGPNGVIVTLSLDVPGKPNRYRCFTEGPARCSAGINLFTIQGGY
ncbi:hypothetical protein ACFYPT_40545 [Streptomyces sp. NPDC005529]|uniref:hypothetical protein n=1 Tax=unclassified Streptomyces TaxID=2593676 RepID=UPI0033B973D4